MHLVEPEAGPGQVGRHHMFALGHQPLEPVAAGQGRDQADGDKPCRDSERPA